MNEKTNKIHKLIFISIFLLIIILPLIFFSNGSGEFSSVENRNLAVKPKVIYQDKSINYNFYKEFENWVNDHIGLRTQMLQFNTILNHKIFNVSPTDKVIFGENDFLFYTLEDNLKIPMQYYNENNMELESISNNLIGIQEKLKKENIKLMLVLTPSKASVYPEYLPGKNFVTGETQIDILEKYLNNNTNIPIVNTKTPLLEQKNNDEKLLYSKQDTHWNDYGSYIAYKAIIDTLFNENIINSNNYVIPSFQYEEKYGDLAKMSYLFNLFKTEKVPVLTQIENSKAKEVDKNILFNVENNNNYKSFVNKNNMLGNVLIYGDSFMYLFKIPNLLAEHFNTVNLVPNFNLDMEVINKTQPNLLILGITERNINKIVDIKIS